MSIYAMGAKEGRIEVQIGSLSCWVLAGKSKKLQREENHQLWLMLRTRAKRRVQTTYGPQSNRGML